MSTLHIQLFAAFHVTLNGRAVSDFATDKARALLAYLAVERDHPHRRESLATLLWPEQPEKRARQNLRQALSNLRQTLEDTDDNAGFLIIDRNDIQLNPHANVQLDVSEFLTLATACHTHPHRHISACLPCLQRLEAMSVLYRGDFLAGFLATDSTLFEEWALLKREWLHTQAVEALTLLAIYAEQRSDSRVALQYARRLVQLEPWREEAHRQLMRLLAQSGERSAALAQYANCRRAMQRELGVYPTAETERLYAQVRDAPSLPAAQPPPAVLPAEATPFVGRQVERKTLWEMLANPDCRLITLIGVGGIGKSRLALQVAADVRGLYPHGIFFAELSSVEGTAHVVPALARALAFTFVDREPPLRQLINYLRDKTALLLLDGIEHLPEMSELIATLLREAAKLTLLVTSRERLALREEWLYAVEGLAHAPAGVAATDQDDAMRLLLQHIRRLQHNFQPTTANLEAMGEICLMVEGMPLALELAAAWVPERGCTAVVQTLHTGLDLLTTSLRNVPERQRSARATFGHSWALLTPPERYSFARLACFRGGFTEEAAMQVAESSPSILAALQRKSLLRQRNGRYHLHTLLSQFAAEQLQTQPDIASETAVRHAAYYAHFLAVQAPALKGQGQEAALRAIDQEIANVRLAWQWAVTQLPHHAQAQALLQLSLESLCQYYCLRSWYQEAADMFAQATTAVHALPAPDPLLLGRLLARQARCLEFTAPSAAASDLYRQSLTMLDGTPDAALPLYGLGYMSHLQGEHETAHRYLAQSLNRYELAGDQWGVATALSTLCLSLRRQGAFVEARQAGEQSLAIRRAINDQRGIASAQNNLALVLCALGEYDAAAQALEESVVICRNLNHLVGTANAYTSLVHVAARRNDRAQARHYQEEALRLFQQVGDLWGVAIAYNNLGQLWLEDGQAAQACTLLEKAAAVYQQVNIRTGLANALSNLAQARLTLGQVGVAARHFQQALHIAREEGDWPIMLEVVARTAVLWQQAGAAAALDGQGLALLLFALRQPELLDETRQIVAAQVEAQRARCSETAYAHITATAVALERDVVITETLQRLQGMGDRAR